MHTVDVQSVIDILLIIPSAMLCLPMMESRFIIAIITTVSEVVQRMETIAKITFL
jgi:hypothetical protein